MGGVESTSEKKEERLVNDSRVDTTKDSKENVTRRRYLGSLDEVFFGKDNGKTKKTALISSGVYTSETSQLRSPVTRKAKPSHLNGSLGNHCTKEKQPTEVQARQDSRLDVPSHQASNTSAYPRNSGVATSMATGTSTTTCNSNASNCEKVGNSDLLKVTATGQPTSPRHANAGATSSRYDDHINAIKIKSTPSPSSLGNRSEKTTHSPLLKQDLTVKQKQQCGKTVRLAPTWHPMPPHQQIHQKKHSDPTSQQGHSVTDSKNQIMDLAPAKAPTPIATGTTQVKSTKLHSRLPRLRKSFNQDTPVGNGKIAVAAANKPNTVNSSKYPKESQLKVLKPCTTETIVTHKPCNKSSNCHSIPKQNSISAKTLCKSQPQCQRQCQQLVPVVSSIQNHSKQVAVSVQMTVANNATKPMITKQKETVMSTAPDGQKKETISNVQALDAKTAAESCANHPKVASNQTTDSKSNQISTEVELFMFAIQQLPKLAAKHLSDMRNSQKKQTARKLKPRVKKIIKTLQSGEVPVCFLIKEHSEEFSIGCLDDDDENEDEELETLLRSMLSNKILGWNAFQGLLYRYFKREPATRKAFPRLAFCTKSSKPGTKVRRMSDIPPDLKMTKKQRKRKAKNKARVEKEAIENKQSQSDSKQMQKILFSNQPEKELQNCNMGNANLEQAHTELKSDIGQLSIKVTLEKSSKPCDEKQATEIKQPAVVERKHGEQSKAVSATKAKSRSKRKTVTGDETVDCTLTLNQQIADRLTSASSKASTSNSRTSGHSGSSPGSSKNTDNEAVGTSSTERATEMPPTEIPASNSTPSPLTSTANRSHLTSPIPQTISKRLATGDASSNLHGVELKNKSEATLQKSCTQSKNKSEAQEIATTLVTLQKYCTQSSTLEPCALPDAGKSLDTSNQKTIPTEDVNLTCVNNASPAITNGTFVVPNATFTTGKAGPTTTSKYMKASKTKHGKSIHARRFGKVSSEEGIAEGSGKVQPGKVSEDMKTDADKSLRKKKVTSNNKKGSLGKRKLKVKRRILEKTNTKLGLTNLDDIRFCRACADTRQRDGKALFNCTKCDDVFYCSRQCQQDDWEDHKIYCKGFRSKCNRCHTFQKKIVNMPTAVAQA